MVQIPSWAASQEIRCILRNPKVHYHTHFHLPFFISKFISFSYAY